MILPFDRSDIAREFTANAARRGRSYYEEGRVGSLVIENDGLFIEARVRGNASRPYRIEIEVVPGDSPMFLTECTCMVGGDCKHVTATLYAALSPATTQSAVFPLLANSPLDPLSGPLADWLSRLQAATATGSSPAMEMLVFVLDVATNHGFGQHTTVTPGAARRLKSGGLGQPRSVQLSTVAASTAQYVRPEDRLIAQILTLGWRYSTNALPPDAEAADLALRRMMATGRCYWKSKDTLPLSLGPPRSGRLAWRILNDGRQVPVLEADAPAVVLPGSVPWYVDPDSAEAGPLDLGIPAEVAAALAQAPPVEPAQVPALRAALAERLPGLTPPAADVIEEVIKEPPVPFFRLSGYEVRNTYSWYREGPATPVDIAQLCFDYGGMLVDPARAPAEFRQVEGHRILVRCRDEKAEMAALSRLIKLGLIQCASPTLPGMAPNRLTFTLPRPEDWPPFIHRELPLLVAEGWRVEFDPSFRHQVVDAGGDWQADIAETEGDGGWWFSLDLGIEVEGERIPLLPVLVQALKRLRDPSALDTLAVDGTLYARLPDNRLAALPFERVRALLATLVELFDAGALSSDGRLDLSLGEAMGLAEIEAATRLRWLGGERLRNLAARLKDFTGVAPVAVPDDFAAELRPYQREGLNWLQFLRDYELGGILADDMGLGKTVQTLAHILVEKREGRLDGPSLVVCPTSLVPNWRAEAARFAPGLKVVSLHGPDRAARFGDLDGADLALSTYPLLLRDEDALLERDWHLVILDEAQTIKNPAAKATQIACKLKARHRLCLTGTPVENHLGEVWSQFAFLMPGLLGDHKRFTRVFRTPIEKKNDGERRSLLARRLRPFILRRLKTEVAAELPEKTEITTRIELAGDQRDLYETVRLAMNEKVRQAVAAKGLARSHIIILDALLKLRQVCCDPRLVKLMAARKVKSTAKLTRLMEMLPTMIEEGRRVLLFSQFTGMLDLIEAELRQVGIPFVDLRGDTVDRATPVARFQAGEVPLFCLSLKAGGTGLNLTAADTVIHYDPWWNPAVENQATDRAHRIGQDKAVFVYKLIVEGTIEEKMLELQERKRALADGLFDPDRAGTAGFEAADLDLLFQPLG